MSAANGAQRPGTELLQWITGIGAVTAEAVAVHDRCSVGAARARLAAARRRGLLVRAAPLRDQPPLYTATREGLRACGERGLARPSITAANAAHAAACAIVAATLEARFPDLLVLGEPALRRREGGADPGLHCEIGVGYQGSRPRTHRGDLALLDRRHTAMAVVIEVELTVKSPARLERICLGWARCRSVAGVVYLAAPAAERAVRRAVERTAAGDTVVVLPLTALDGTETPSRWR